MFELQKYIWVIFHETEEWCKIWRKNGLKNAMRNLTNFNPSTWNCQSDFDGILLFKVEKVWP